jgi:Flp pilus assembly protein TadG
MKLLKDQFYRLMRRNQSGQSIIVLAIGFVALVGFVGITTDVALMFVRYSQLSRAVDAAAIAAANQMRQDRTFAQLGMAARQYIELYGLSPTSVLVENCISTNSSDPELCTLNQDKLVRVTAQIDYEPVFMRLLGFQRFTLQARAISQTASLDVVIIMDVNESMTNYTGLDDWASVGLSVAYRPPRAIDILTNLNQIMGQPINDSQMWLGQAPMTPADSLVNTWQANVNSRLNYVSVTAGSAPQPVHTRTTYETQYVINPLNLAGAQAQPRPQCRVRFAATSMSMPATSANFWYATFDGPSTNLPLYSNVAANDTLFKRMGWTFSAAGSQINWAGFVPTYNFYGCCNDPTDSNNFSNLICQPFKQTRDAVVQFMDRVDFTRGDRMAIVTFDRSAFLVNPYGFRSDGSRQGAMMDNGEHALWALRNLVGVRSEQNSYQFVPGTITNPSTPLTARWVRYAAGMNLASSIPADYDRVTPNFSTISLTNSSFNLLASAPEIVNYPVKSNCLFGTASVFNTRSLFGNGSLPNPLTRTSIPNSSMAGWAGYSSGGLTIPGNPDTAPVPTIDDLGRMSYERQASCQGSNIGAGLREGNNALLDPTTVRRSGTVWVMIMLANSGAGRTDPVRRNRTFSTTNVYTPYTYVPASNPPRFGRQNNANAYGIYGVCPYGTPGNPGELVSITDDIARTGIPGLAEFPYCSDEIPMTRNRCNFRPRFLLNPGTDPLPPLYKDINTNATCAGPSSTCRAVPPMGDAGYIFYAPSKSPGPASQQTEMAWNQLQGYTYDIDLGTGCDSPERYDADDYARDWADFVSVRPSDTNELLPTIFTIGFGMEYNRTGGFTRGATDQTNVAGICQWNLADCLGEELLRYIADAGDNNQIDNDYWQYFLQANPSTTVAYTGTDLERDGYGPRDPCQTGGISFTNNLNGGAANFTPAQQATAYGQLPAQTSCGNYYFAPDYNQLQFVFDDIASRMFTRLSR